MTNFGKLHPQQRINSNPQSNNRSQSDNQVKMKRTNFEEEEASPKKKLKSNAKSDEF